MDLFQICFIIVFEIFTDTAPIYCCHCPHSYCTTGCYSSLTPGGWQSLPYGRWTMDGEHGPLPRLHVSGEQSSETHLYTVSSSCLEAGVRAQEWDSHLFNSTSTGPSPMENTRRTALSQSIWDHPSSWGRCVAAWGFSLAQASGFSRTELRVSLPGPGLPEFSRSRTILGNLCAQGTTNMFVFIQHSLLCLSQTPPFGRNHSPRRNVPVGFGKFFLYLNEVLPLVFVKSFQKKSFLWGQVFSLVFKKNQMRVALYRRHCWRWVLVTHLLTSHQQVPSSEFYPICLAVTHCAQDHESLCHGGERRRSIRVIVLAMLWTTGVWVSNKKAILHLLNPPLPGHTCSAGKILPHTIHEIGHSPRLFWSLAINISSSIFC